MPSLTLKDKYRKQMSAMVTERSTFISYWGQLSDYILAHRGRFLVEDRNKGHERNDKQINNVARIALRTLASGMMIGMTPQTRPWFTLGLSNGQLIKDDEVKRFLLRTEKVMQEIFSQSNLYNSLHIVYQELGTFGTTSMGVYEDFENVIRCKPYTIGSFVIALNGKDQVDTWGREYQRTVAQVVDQFGKENCSTNVQNLWDRGELEQWIDLTHLIQPNDDRSDINPLAKYKKYRSVYYENAKSSQGFLLQSGFEDFPILAPRWEVTGEDIYATACPGMDALGDTKALQTGEIMKYEGIEKQIDPHMVADAEMRNTVGNHLPAGEISFVNNLGNGAGLKSAYDVQIRLQDHIKDIEKIERRIDTSFYADLFLMLANTDRRQMTAREVAEKHGEKMMMIGPVLGRLHTELLDPLIDRTFNIGMRAGIFGRVPEVLRGKDLEVEYISILARAQKLVDVEETEQFVGSVGQMSEIWPEARYKINISNVVDELADSRGVSPDLIVSDEEFTNRLAVDKQQAEQAQLAAAGQPMAESAKTLSETDTEGKNALTDLMEQA